MRQWWFALFVVVVLVGSARADTGGQMGGGSWGGGGGGTSSSSSSSSGGGWSSSSRSSSSDSSWSSSRRKSSSSDYNRTYPSSGRTYSGYDTGPGPEIPWGVLGIVAILALGVGAIYLYAIRPVVRPYVPEPYYGDYSAGFGSIDVSVVRIAIDGRARKFVQTELARIAKVADTATEAGRATMLREVTLLLRRVRDAWVYGGAVNEPMREPGAAKAVFDRHVDDARVKFKHTTIANVQGVTTAHAAPEYRPRSDEGTGLILVTLVVAAKSELFTVAHIGDGEDLRKALEAASYRSPSDLVAIDILWQPSEDSDRLSSLELEAKYPRPALIPIAGALVGKMFCGYCSGPYPAELVSCPHCGGSAEAAPRAA